MSNIDGNLDMLGALMDRCAVRSRVLAGNIANMDTPGYKAKDVVFKEVLEKVVDRDSDMRIGRDRQIRYKMKYKPEIVEKTADPRPDGNTVKADQEMVKFSSNAITFMTALRLYSMKSNILKIAIKGG